MFFIGKQGNSTRSMWTVIQMPGLCKILMFNKLKYIYFNLSISKQTLNKRIELYIAIQLQTLK